MKVLHVESGRHLYGGALQVMFLLRGLRERGVDGLLACPPGSAIATACQPFADVQTVVMKGDVDIGMVGRLRRLIREQRPDLVHLHSRRGADTWGALAGKLEGVPVVLSRRVDNPESPTWVRIKYRLYDRVITISQGIRQVLLSEGLAPQRVQCVPSAVDTEHYRPLPDQDAAASLSASAWFRQTFNLAAGDLAVGMMAQFIPRKGHHLLLDALPAVLARHPQARFLLFGQGPEHAGVAQRVRADPLLAAHVQLPGFRTDLDRILPCLDLVVHPAAMEGLGVALLQTAACGVAMVATRAGGIPEIVIPGHTGELVEPGDAAALASALDALLGDAARRQRYGAAARLWVQAHFSIPAMVDGNLEVYRQVLGARP